MSITMTKVRALLKKDFKDTLKNPQCLLMGLLPLLFAVLYTNMNFGGEGGMPPMMVLMLCTLMNTSLNTLSVMAMMIAEEKEKNTLRTLMLSNVSAGDFLISKTTVAFVITEVINLLIFVLCKTEGLPLGRFLLSSAGASICLLLIGAIIGIVSKNQMATGVLSAPAALLLMLPAIFAEISDTFSTIAKFTPTRAMVLLMQPEEPVLVPLLVLVAWTVLAALLFAVIFRKKRLD